MHQNLYELRILYLMYLVPLRCVRFGILGLQSTAFDILQL